MLLYWNSAWSMFDQYEHLQPYQVWQRNKLVIISSKMRFFQKELANFKDAMFLIKQMAFFQIKVLFQLWQQDNTICQDYF